MSRPRGGKLYSKDGFTLIEIMLGTFILVVAIVSLIGAFLGQSILNSHARNLTAGMNDATRIMEQIRQTNFGSDCTSPSAMPPDLNSSWDAWLGGGRSAQAQAELVAVTCQDENGGSFITDYCGRPPAGGQVGAGEWKTQDADTQFDPIRVTVAVCWRDRNRNIGECTWDGSTLDEDDADFDGIIESPATLTTLITCRDDV